ncbi:MAG: hypothetical protein LBR77_00675 [Lachnospiraceae bacterium]|jgi:hypothetical protein|nr:hypothetical protein [Lachnospiraceae bacterium]
MKRWKMWRLLAVTAMVAVMGACLPLASFAATEEDEKEELEQVSDLWWNDAGTVIYWEPVENAYQYKVSLYRNSAGTGTPLYTKTVSRSTHSLDVYSKMNNVVGVYTFRVQALGKGDYTNAEVSDVSDYYELETEMVAARKAAREESEAEEERKQTATGDIVPGLAGGPGVTPPATANEWIEDTAKGLWWYRHADGSYTKLNWELIDGKWYYFDGDGWMVTGWLEWDGGRYYLSQLHDGTYGAMVTGAMLEDGVAYHFEDSGKLIESVAR